MIRKEVLIGHLKLYLKNYHDLSSHASRSISSQSKLDSKFFISLIKVD